jgi:hypothetical protein
MMSTSQAPLDRLGPRRVLSPRDGLQRPRSFAVLEGPRAARRFYAVRLQPRFVVVRMYVCIFGEYGHRIT